MYVTACTAHRIASKHSPVECSFYLHRYYLFHNNSFTVSYKYGYLTIYEFVETKKFYSEATGASDSLDWYSASDVQSIGAQGVQSIGTQGAQSIGAQGAQSSATEEGN